MLRVMEMHIGRRSTRSSIAPTISRSSARPVSGTTWSRQGRQNGFRNAQATVLAPTGTISFMMDCDTTGIEPDIALVKYKQLAGGGVLKTGQPDGAAEPADAGL